MKIINQDGTDITREEIEMLLAAIQHDLTVLEMSEQDNAEHRAYLESIRAHVLDIVAGQDQPRRATH